MREKTDALNSPIDLISIFTVKICGKWEPKCGFSLWWYKKGKNPMMRPIYKNHAFRMDFVRVLELSTSIKFHHVKMDTTTNSLNSMLLILIWWIWFPSFLLRGFISFVASFFRIYFRYIVHSIFRNNASVLKY